jgi:hypothetical protein
MICNIFQRNFDGLVTVTSSGNIKQPLEEVLEVELNSKPPQVARIFWMELDHLFALLVTISPIFYEQLFRMNVFAQFLSAYNLSL